MWQGGFLADDGDEVVAQLVKFIGDGVEEVRAAGRAQLAEFRKGGFGGQRGGVDFAVGGLVKAVRQFFTRGGIQALLQALAQGTAAACDEVLAENVRHRYLLLFDVGGGRRRDPDRALLMGCRVALRGGTGAAFKSRPAIMTRESVGSHRTT
ncbi:hypothetical protein ALO94_200732 [Pseudomonas syringae pv. spinaceae]|uniref:Endoribonuclease L-PSP family protein n=1 Tax=Pseudomonas syringae pv. spinaceae TaxID=264459 RepID=A0A0Q0B7W3_PSESX|nr:hypothetical protein ALO94_200732 [Pseudomonas syringae pv. spinaceae]